MNFWAGKSAFVTGATGLVGGWLVKELLTNGAEVTVLVRDALPKTLLSSEGLRGRVTCLQGSITDASLMRRAISEYEPDAVFHLAAQTLVGAAKKDPVSTLETNVRGTWNVLEACRLVGVRGVVVASSDKAYGASRNLPYQETHPLEGRYPYDCSKSCTDLITTMYATTYGVPAVIARCGNIFGGGDLNFSRVIPGLIRATLAGEPFVIRSDGRYVRDFLYVRDAALAYMWLAQTLSADPTHAGGAFNFSIETRLTVIEIVRTTLELMGRADLEPLIQNIASNEIREQYMSCEKASALGWSPTYSMQAGIRETIQWYRNFFQPANGNQATLAATS